MFGYRVTSASGDLVEEFPSEGFGSPTEFLVGPEWDMKVTFSLPTLRSQAEDPGRRIIWYSEADTLPVGEYTLEAGLNEMENQYPWGTTNFTVVAPQSK